VIEAPTGSAYAARVAETAGQGLAPHLRHVPGEGYQPSVGVRRRPVQIVDALRFAKLAASNWSKAYLVQNKSG
jgi:hypothetical protein